jgi:hypothetical protein
VPALLRCPLPFIHPRSEPDRRRFDARRFGALRFLAAATAAGVLGGGILLAAGPAAAATRVRPETTLSTLRPVVSGSRYTLHGSVRSDSRPIRRDRVRIYAQRSNGRRVLLGVSRTGGRGGFTFTSRAVVPTLVIAEPTATAHTQRVWTRSVWVRVEAALGVRVVRIAASLRGRPYAYGAAGPGAFDCSGFTMYVFGRLGVRLPHNAQEQYDAVRHVSRSHIALGDLVFFGGSAGIYHVGIYAGHHRVWHAPHTGTVVALQRIWTSDYLVGEVR